MAPSTEIASTTPENGNAFATSNPGSMGPTSSNGITESPGASFSYSGAHYHRDQRRKRVTGFATLKRKFIRRRRSSKACDHARVLRDFVSEWTPLELAALCEEFEALAALRDLSVIEGSLSIKLSKTNFRFVFNRYKQN